MVVSIRVRHTLFDFAKLPLVASPIGSSATDEISQAVARVCHDRRLTNVTLIRQSMNAVYRVDSPTGPLVLRVSHTTADPIVAIELSEYLLLNGFTVPAPATHHSFRHDEIFVTLWEFIEADRVIEPSWTDVGSMVRQLHDLDPAEIAKFYPLPLATSFPWWDFSAILEELAPTIAAADFDALQRSWTRHRLVIERIAHTTMADATKQLVVCHGDIHPGNVMIDRRTGRTMLIDWDLLCCAPRPWDHSALHTWSSRWGGSPSIYDHFIHGYGVDFRQDYDLMALAELRLLSATLMRWRAALSDPNQVAEAERRMMWWRGDSLAPMWQAV